MNFLEQLVAEWYEYRGYFVRCNVNFGKRGDGGWEGEMDVIAFQPLERSLVHIEVSTDASGWDERRRVFERATPTVSRWSR